MRVFEILDEIIDAVETAKGVPMSSSAIINRPALLDLLDDLRDAFPGAVEDAREILEQRDEIVDSARTEAARVHDESTSEANRRVAEAKDAAQSDISRANAQAEATITQAQDEADRLIQATRVEVDSRKSQVNAQAEQVIADAHAERDRLVSEHEVHRTAAASASTVTEEAGRKAEALGREAEQYVDQQLSELALTLQKLSATVERGRERVQHRSSSSQSESGAYSDSAAYSEPPSYTEAEGAVYNQER